MGFFYRFVGQGELTIMRLGAILKVLLITCGTTCRGLALANQNTEAPPLSVKMDDVLYYQDGGTTGFEAEVDGHKELFCFDGRMVPASDSLGKRHVYLNATHPSHVGASKIPIGGKEEARIITILATWIDSELSHSKQQELLQGSAPRTDLKETKLWWALRVKENLDLRQNAPNKSFQRTLPSGQRR